MNDNLDNYIGKVEHLPATPAVLVKMLALFRQPDRDVDEIVELMRQDPSLTAEVLRHSNSAYFGTETPIVDVFEAIMRMGFYEVYQIAVAKLGSQALSLPQGRCGIDVETLWRHSLTAAATTGVLAKKLGEHEGLAFTAGLLHDVGKIVLASAEGPAYTAMAAEHGMGGSSRQAAEVKLFGFGHSEVGARLLGRWKLPEEISLPVRHHHDVVWPAQFERFCAIVSLGNLMAHAAEDSIPGKQYESEEAVCAMRVLQLGQNDLELLLPDAQSDIKRMTGLLAVAAK